MAFADFLASGWFSDWNIMYAVPAHGPSRSWFQFTVGMRSLKFYDSRLSLCSAHSISAASWYRRLNSPVPGWLSAQCTASASRFHRAAVPCLSTHRTPRQAAIANNGTGDRGRRASAEAFRFRPNCTHPLSLA